MLIKFEQDLPSVQDPTKIPRIGFILDESSSMYSVWQETMAGFNSYINTIRTELPNAKLTFASFVNYMFKLRSSDKPVDEVLPLNLKNYTPYGGTPLVDSVMAIIHLIEQQVNIHPTCQPIVVVQTDGHENSSKTYTMEELNEVVQKKRKEGWQFILITCKIDATVLANSMGIDPGAALTYGRGKSLHAFEAVSRLTTQGVKEEQEQVFSIEDQRRTR